MSKESPIFKWCLRLPTLIFLIFTSQDVIFAQIDSNKLRIERLLFENEIFQSHLDTIIDGYEYMYIDTLSAPSYKLDESRFPYVYFIHESENKTLFSDYPISKTLKERNGILITPWIDMAYDYSHGLLSYWIDLDDYTVWSLNWINGSGDYIGQVPESLNEKITTLK